jgi:hypothetical protein
MNRILGSAAVGAGAFVLLAGAAAGGYALQRAGTTNRTVTVTLTRTPPPKVITKVKTRTVSAPPSIPCQDIGGSPEPGDHPRPAGRHYVHGDAHVPDGRVPPGSNQTDHARRAQLHVEPGEPERLVFRSPRLWGARSTQGL